MVKNQSNKYSKEFLNKTIEVWQPYSSIPLSLHDAREITENMTALFGFILSEDKKQENKNKNKKIILNMHQEGGENT